jgi:hypothetical protein
LPENILTNDLEEEFFKVAEFKDMAEKVKHVKKNVNRLPPCNKQTLKLYIEHLVFVAEKQDVNQMTVENLLLCITGASSNTPVFFVLILNYEEIFLGVTPTKEEKIQKLEKLNYVITTDSLMPKAKDGEYEGKDSKEEDEEVELKEVTIKEVVKQEEVAPTLEVLKQEEEEKKEIKQEEKKMEQYEEEKKVDKHEEEEEEEKKVEQHEEEKKMEQHEEETSVEKQQEELNQMEKPEEELNQMMETLQEMEKPEEKEEELKEETKQELKEMEQLQEELELKQESHLLEEKQNLDEKIETPQPSSESSHQVLPEETKKEEEHQ